MANTINLKEVIKKYEWWNNIKFEIKYSKNGVARIYINDRKTKYYAGGYGYDKESSVIAEIINDLTISNCKYNKKMYGNNGKKLSAGVGFSSIYNSFNAKRKCKLEKIYCGLDSDVYEITFNSKLLWFNEIK